MISLTVRVFFKNEQQDKFFGIFDCVIQGWIVVQSQTVPEPMHGNRHDCCQYRSLVKDFNSKYNNHRCTQVILCEKTITDIY